MSPSLGGTLTLLLGAVIGAGLAAVAERDSTDQPISPEGAMVLEVRIYKIRSGMRDRFVRFFDERALPAQQEVGMRILGQFTSLEDETTFVWLRAFADAEERERQRAAFYEGPVWKEELEVEALSMIEDYSNVLLVTPTPRSAIR